MDNLNLVLNSTISKIRASVLEYVRRKQFAARRRNAHNAWVRRHKGRYENLIIYDARYSRPYMVKAPYAVLADHLAQSCRFVITGSPVNLQVFLMMCALFGFSGFFLFMIILFFLFGGILLALVGGLVGGGIGAGVGLLLAFQVEREGRSGAYWIVDRTVDGRVEPADVHQDMGLTPQFLRELMKLDADRRLLARKSKSKMQNRMALGAVVAISVVCISGLILITALVGG